MGRGCTLSVYGFDWLQVERIWGIVNVHAQEIHGRFGEVMKDKRRPPRLQWWKVSFALQLSSRKKDIRKLKKIYQELDEFVTVKEEKRYVGVYLSESCQSHQLHCRFFRDWFMGLTEEEKAEKILHIISEGAEDVR